MVNGMADNNEVRLPYGYYPDPTRGRPVFKGQIFVGLADTDPQIASNQIQVYAVQEDGTTVAIAQPIRTNAGGVPDLNGSAVQLIVDGEHSMKVLDAQGAQVYYAPSLVGGVRPTTILRTQLVPLSLDLNNRFVNSILFRTNTSGADYFSRFSVKSDFGNIRTAPFSIEKIPEERFDLAEGSGTVNLGGLA
ncbi:tailspike protein [Pseudomonas phage AH02]|nr:tailspike protein [Pseudomonas phage AH02]